jgi:hypothetical protein
VYNRADVRKETSRQAGSGVEVEDEKRSCSATARLALSSGMIDRLTSHVDVGLISFQKTWVWFCVIHGRAYSQSSLHLGSEWAAWIG